MLDGDQDRVNRCTLPAEGREVLTKGQHPSGAELDAAKSSIQNLALQQLNVGDVVKMPNGKSVTLDASMVNQDHMQITGPSIPVPFSVVRKGDEWKVDAGALIAARGASGAGRAGGAAAPAASLGHIDAGSGDLLIPGEVHIAETLPDSMKWTKQAEQQHLIVFAAIQPGTTSGIILQQVTDKSYRDDSRRRQSPPS